MVHDWTTDVRTYVATWCMTALKSQKIESRDTFKVAPL
jgi:hypothetical protein